MLSSFLGDNMKFNFHGRHSNLEHRGERSALEKLMDNLRQWSDEHFLERQIASQKEAALLGFGVISPLEKTTPDVTKNLTATTKTNSHGVASVQFSDGSGYTDYGNLAPDHSFRKLLDRMIEKGSLKVVEIYKPDGSTFQAVVANPAMQTLKTDGPVPAAAPAPA
jgi:hypothetical protein